MAVLGLLGFLVLTFLPGAWIAFGLPLKQLPFLPRVFISLMLSPLIVAAQFYVLRLAGIPFGPTCVILTLVNLPALYLIIRQRVQFPRLERSALLAGGLIALILLVSIAPFLLDPQKRVYTWEAWSQADAVYSLANGEIDLQDSELAETRLSYPWVGSVYQAAHSYLTDSPPASNYIWENLLWLIGIFGLAAGIVAELGGNQLAQVSVAVWLSFGVNFVGTIGSSLVPAAWIHAHPILGSIWGDNRFSPWLDKAVFFGQMYFGMGLFMAVLYLVLKSWPVGARKYFVVTLGLALIGLGLIYPVLLPPACIVVAARGLMILLGRWRAQPDTDLREVAALALVSVAALALTLAYTRFLTQGRAGGTLVNLHDLRTMRSYAIECVIVTSPLLAGLAVLFVRYWRERQSALVILGLGALGSFVLYILFDVPWWRNEYKFIFTAAMCLAPFPSLALEPILRRLGRLAVPMLAVLAVILAMPFALDIYTRGNTQTYTKLGPVVDVSHFDLRLQGPGHLASLYDAIREKTPVNSLLVLEEYELHVPTLTRRQLYVAPSQLEPSPGILISSDDMLTLMKGYSAQVIADRRLVVRQLFDSDDPTQMAASLQRISAFNRPLVLILDEQRQAALEAWLAQQKIGGPLDRADGYQLWWIDLPVNNAAQ